MSHYAHKYTLAYILRGFPHKRRGQLYLPIVRSRPSHPIQSFFAITPLRITIDNVQKGDNSCFDTNPLQDQPQPSSSPPQNAYGSSVQLATGFPSGSVPPITAGPITYTIGSAGIPSGWIIETPGQTPIITETKAITTATVVIASVETVTTTLPAQNVISTLTCVSPPS